jgi:hypothetical protein
MDKGYTKEIIEKNILSQMDEGQSEMVAVSYAVSKARNDYKKDHPDTIRFPAHLAPGSIIKTYLKGGDLSGEG